jgi:tRNA A37 threonylcarbamoyladenosine modification protein TsaB
VSLLILDGAGPGVRASFIGVGAREGQRAGELAALVGELMGIAGGHTLTQPSPGGRGLAARPVESPLPPEMGWVTGARPPEAIVAMVGPGSFTGLRAALALAHGLSAGGGAPLVAVAAAEAFAEAHPGRRLLAAFAGGRKGRYVIQRIGADAACAAPVACDEADIATLGTAEGTLVVGPAAAAIAALLNTRGRDVAVEMAARPSDTAIAAVARGRLAGRLPPRAPLPLYADDLFDRR